MEADSSDTSGLSADHTVSTSASSLSQGTDRQSGFSSSLSQGTDRQSGSSSINWSFSAAGSSVDISYTCSLSPVLDVSSSYAPTSYASGSASCTILGAQSSASNATSTITSASYTTESSTDSTSAYSSGSKSDSTIASASTPGCSIISGSSSSKSHLPKLSHLSSPYQESAESDNVIKLSDGDVDEPDITWQYWSPVKTQSMSADTTNTTAAVGRGRQKRKMIIKPETSDAAVSAAGSAATAAAAGADGNDVDDDDDCEKSFNKRRRCVVIDTSSTENSVGSFSDVVNQSNKPAGSGKNVADEWTGNVFVDLSVAESTFNVRV